MRRGPIQGVVHFRPPLHRRRRGRRKLEAAEDAINVATIVRGDVRRQDQGIVTNVGGVRRVAKGLPVEVAGVGDGDRQLALRRTAQRRPRLDAGRQCAGDQHEPDHTAKRFLSFVHLAILGRSC